MEDEKISDKIIYGESCLMNEYYIREEDVKEFIRLLKEKEFIERLGARANQQYISGIKDCMRYIEERIDKLAGEKLI